MYTNKTVMVCSSWLTLFLSVTFTLNYKAENFPIHPLRFSFLLSSG